MLPAGKGDACAAGDREHRLGCLRHRRRSGRRYASSGDRRRSRDGVRTGGRRRRRRLCCCCCSCGSRMGVQGAGRRVGSKEKKKKKSQLCMTSLSQQEFEAEKRKKNTKLKEFEIITAGLEVSIILYASMSMADCGAHEAEHSARQHPNAGRWGVDLLCSQWLISSPTSSLTFTLYFVLSLLIFSLHFV